MQGVYYYYKWGEREKVCKALKEKKSLRSQQPGAWVKETASHAAEATSAPLPWGEKSEVPPRKPGLALGLRGASGGCLWSC